MRYKSSVPNDFAGDEDAYGYDYLDDEDEEEDSYFAGLKIPASWGATPANLGPVQQNAVSPLTSATGPSSTHSANQSGLGGDQHNAFESAYGLTASDPYGDDSFFSSSEEESEAEQPGHGGDQDDVFENAYGVGGDVFENAYGPTASDPYAEENFFSSSDDEHEDEQPEQEAELSHGDDDRDHDSGSGGGGGAVEQHYLYADYDSDDVAAADDPFDVPVQAAKPEEPEFKRVGKHNTRRLPDRYEHEQERAGFRGAANTWNSLAEDRSLNFTNIKTRYYSDQEQQERQISVKDGLIHGANGLLDTSGASGAGTQHDQGKGKHIFAMTGDGDIRTTDPWADHRETRLHMSEGEQVRRALERRRHQATGKEGATPENDAELSMINHSSLLGGGRAAGAGEITVDQGKLTQVSDSSGHYTPTNEMTHQVVKELEGQGVDMHDVSMKLVPKTGDHMMSAPAGHHLRNLHASAREFMAYGGSAKAEKKMRKQRNVLRDQLADAVAAREARLAGGNLRTTEVSGSRQDSGGHDVAASVQQQTVAATPELRDPRQRAAARQPEAMSFADRRDMFEKLSKPQDQ